MAQSNAAKKPAAPKKPAAKKPAAKKPEQTPAKPANGNAPLPQEFNCPERLKGLHFDIGGKPYSPRVHHNIVAWGKVSTRLPATGEELAEALQQHANKPEEDHYNFLFYLQRRGALRVVQK